MKRVVFLDVGGVILDEANLEKEKAAKKQFHTDWRRSKAEFHPMPGLQAWARRISARHRLGLLGQYGDEVLGFLHQLGILDCFTYTDTQDKFSLTKPDPRYFEAVVDRAGQKPEHCVMVGDRIDKDIIPAKQVGMKTIRMRTGIHRHQEPRTPPEFPDLTVDSLDEITEQALDRL